MSVWESEEKRSYDVADLRQEYRARLYTKKGGGRMSERVDGPYWVRSEDAWEIALWTNRFAPLGWKVFGGVVHYGDSDFDEIGPRIPEPERKG